MTKSKWLKSSSGRSRYSLLLPLVCANLLLVTGCTASDVLKGLVGGGPQLNANVQAGKTNSQTLGTNKNNSPTVSLRPKSRVDTIDQSSSEVRNDKVEYQTINEIPVWVILLLILGWLLPSPGEIGRNISSFILKLRGHNG